MTERELTCNECQVSKQTNKQTKESFLPCLTRGVSHCVALPFTLKKSAKEELWKSKYFIMQQNIIFKKLISNFNTSQNIIFQ
jgi:hypothetical protein